ncbi:MAG: hypothetical protein R3F61_04535 [Myxococcota bacterium]
MRTSLLFAATAVLGTLMACTPPGEGDPGPRVSDLSTESHTDLIDRAALLSDAQDPSAAPMGEALDLRGAGAGYLLQAFDGETLTEGADEMPRSYSNYLAAVAGVIAVDVTTALVIAPPAIAVGVAADGTLVQTAPNVWEATNTVDLLGTPVTTHLTVAWVGVGWLSEMRLSSDDVSEQLWFDGFVSNDGQVGWWDFYENGTDLAGVVEWTSDGVDGQFGYGATKGDNAGDVVVYASLDGVGSVSVYDASADELVWVAVNEDQSGSVRLLDFNGGVEACWDTAYLDAPCPQ